MMIILPSEKNDENRQLIIIRDCAKCKSFTALFYLDEVFYNGSHDALSCSDPLNYEK